MTYSDLFTAFKKHPCSSLRQQKDTEEDDAAAESDRPEDEEEPDRQEEEEVADLPEDEEQEEEQTEDTTQKPKVSINFYDSVLAFKDIFTLCHLCFVIMYSCMFECLDIFQHALLQCLYVS